MADSILRLKVESQEYDNKLKQATNGLTRYVDECRKVGGTLEVVEKETLDYVRALGQMETTSRTATGKLAEMKKTFTELSAQYKQMTDAEKQSPFGKTLAASLDQLKTRIQEGKSQLDDINKSVNGGGGLTGALDSLSDKFGMSIQSLAGWGTALAAGKAALDVAKDAFFASEATVDEWGRVMDSSKSLYEGFLTSLNTGDISGYLSRIDSIVQAARAAYNELDRLGTMKTIQAPQMSAQQTENERMRMMIQTGRYIAPVDGRRASMQNGQLLTPDQIKRIEQQLQGGMQKVVTLVGNEVAQTGRAIDAVYNRQAQELGMSLKEFRKGTSSMAEFDKRMAGYDQYQKWRQEHTTIDIQSGRETVARGNPFEQFAKWGTFRVDGDRYNDLVKLIQQRDQQAGQAYSMQSQAYRTMNRAEGVTLRQIMGGGSGGVGGRSGGGGNNGQTYAPDSIAAMEADVSNLTKLWKEAGAAVRDDYAAQLEEAKLRLDTVTGKNSSIAFSPEMAARQLEVAQGKNVVEIPLSSDLTFDEWLSDVKAKLENTKINPIVVPLETTKNNVEGIKEAAKATAKVVGTIGNAFNAIEDPAAKVAATVAQAIANIALAYSDALAKTTGEKFNIWGFIAASAAAMVSMGTTIASIHQATGYAHGGMIKGNSYSGDNIGGLVDGSQLVGLNAGEIVLNAAGQQNVAANLRGGAMGGMSLKTKVRGTELLVWLDNSLAQSGRGEMVTWGT